MHALPLRHTHTTKLRTRRGALLGHHGVECAKPEEWAGLEARPFPPRKSTEQATCHMCPLRCMSAGWGLLFCRPLLRTPHIPAQVAAPHKARSRASGWHSMRRAPAQSLRAKPLAQKTPRLLDLSNEARIILNWCGGGRHKPEGISTSHYRASAWWLRFAKHEDKLRRSHATLTARKSPDGHEMSHREANYHIIASQSTCRGHPIGRVARHTAAALTYFETVCARASLRRGAPTVCSLLGDPKGAVTRSCCEADLTGKDTETWRSPDRTPCVGSHRRRSTLKWISLVIFDSGAFNGIWSTVATRLKSRMTSNLTFVSTAGSCTRCGANSDGRTPNCGIKIEVVKQTQDNTARDHTRASAGILPQGT